MSYTCQNCGVEAEQSSSLCNPSSEDQSDKFCGFGADQVCEDKVSEMKFTCDSCGSVSVDSEHLCNPREIR